MKNKEASINYIISFFPVHSAAFYCTENLLFAMKREEGADDENVLLEVYLEAETGDILPSKSFGL